MKRLSKLFITNKGLLQGCPLSPTLLKFHTPVSLQGCSRKYGIMGIEVAPDRYVHHLLFADDEVVTFQDGEDANYSC